MKFGKISLLTAVLFAVFMIVFSTACERNVCDNVTCFNGGSCNSGTCRCPIGYEGEQCQVRSTARYAGMYVGYYSCDNGAYLIDTAWVTPDPVKINWVYLTYKHIAPQTLHGYVSNNESTYSIMIPSDSSKNYVKVFTATLQGDKVLNIHTYMTDEHIVGDTIIEKCFFYGSKQ